MTKIPVTLDVDIPEGYEATGEFRSALKGEYFIADIGRLMGPAGKDFGGGPRIILRKLEPPEPPAGYELTGEYRKPNMGERFISTTVTNCAAQYSGCNLDRSNGVNRWILRKAWQPPKWMPEGSWLYLSPKGWWVTPTKPSGNGTGFYGMACNISFPAEELAALSRETFEPPTHTKCIQVRHS